MGDNPNKAKKWVVLLKGMGGSPNPDSLADSNAGMGDNPNKAESVSSRPADNPDGCLDLLPSVAMEDYVQVRDALKQENIRLKEEVIVCSRDFLEGYKCYEEVLNSKAKHYQLQPSSEQQIESDHDSLQFLSKGNSNLKGQLKETSKCLGMLQSRLVDAVDAADKATGPATEEVNEDVAQEVQELIVADEVHEDNEGVIVVNEDVAQEVRELIVADEVHEDNEGVIVVNEYVAQYVQELIVADEVHEDNEGVIVVNEAAPPDEFFTLVECDSPWMRWRSGGGDYRPRETMGVIKYYRICNLFRDCRGRKHITQQHGQIMQVHYINMNSHNHPVPAHFEPSIELRMASEMTF